MTNAPETNTEFFARLDANRRAIVQADKEADHGPAMDDEDNRVSYEVSVTNTFDAECPEDAVRQMIDWLVDNAPSTGYRVHNSDTGALIGFYDGDDV